MADIVGNETLRSLWEALGSQCASREFLIAVSQTHPPRHFTYGNFFDEIKRCANAFLALGVRPQDMVAVQLRTSPEFLIVLFGLTVIGAVAVPLNDQYVAKEIHRILERTNAVGVVIEPRHRERYRAVLAEPLPSLRFLAFERTSFARGEGGGAEGFSAACHVVDFEGRRKAAPLGLSALAPLGSDDTAEVLFTSGTTSEPKGVVVTHANLLYSGIYGDWEMALGSGDRMLTTMPACHSNFQMAALMPVLTVGASLVLVEKFSASRYWSQIREYRATYSQAMSMMVRTLLLQPEDEGERAHCLRGLLYYLPLTAEEKDAFEARFNVRLMNTYGSTESVGWVLTDPPVGMRRWPSVGRVGLGYQVRIAREDGAAQKIGKTGEIQVLGVPGRSVFREYFNDPASTRAAFTEDGWLRTADEGYQDADGWFYFVDRKAHLIKRAGENISATELEKILAGHPAIAEAAVVGVPDPIRDEAVKAFIRLKRAGELSAEDVLDYCRGKMAAFKMPSSVVFVDDFPRTHSGKIRKNLLK